MIGYYSVRLVLLFFPHLLYLEIYVDHHRHDHQKASRHDYKCVGFGLSVREEKETASLDALFVSLNRPGIRKRAALHRGALETDDVPSDQKKKRHPSVATSHHRLPVRPSFVAIIISGSIGTIVVI